MTREDGASGTPRFLDVNVAMSEANKPCLITGAQYGLASKEFTPAVAKAVYDNLNEENPHMKYVFCKSFERHFTGPCNIA